MGVRVCGRPPSFIKPREGHAHAEEIDLKEFDERLNSQECPEAIREIVAALRKAAKQAGPPSWTAHSGPGGGWGIRGKRDRRLVCQFDPKPTALHVARRFRGRRARTPGRPNGPPSKERYALGRYQTHAGRRGARAADRAGVRRSGRGPQTMSGARKAIIETYAEWTAMSALRSSAPIKSPARRTASPSRTLIADSKSGGPKQVWALVPGGNLVALAFAGTVSEREDGPRGTVKEVRGAVRLVPEILRAYDAASLAAAKRR